jgi:hypothetical protein
MWTHPDILWDLAKQRRDEIVSEAEKGRLLRAARRRRTGHRRGQR